MKRGQLRRKPSDAWLAEREQLEELRPLIEVRAGHRCEICRVGQPVVLHHKLRRSQGGKHSLANLLGLCNCCHEQVHARPEWSYTQGYLTHSWAAQASDPVGAGTPLLGADQ